jgi:tRNA pseudouridine55 synthase
MPIYLDKKKGITPLELIKQYKKENNFQGKMCYAGRLDPMARGKMILLKDEECKQMNDYCNLDKTYEFLVLFGIKTDTYDLLGKVIETYISPVDVPKLDLDKFIGEIEQPYPAYSSFIIRHNEERKPIWEWAKLNKLDEITIPEKEVEIFSLGEISYSEKIETQIDLEKYIFDNINLLSDVNKKKFRVNEILEIWKQIFETLEFKPIIKKYRANVSSGTYIRSLVNRMGIDLGCGAITLDIDRVELKKI